MKLWRNMAGTRTRTGTGAGYKIGTGTGKGTDTATGYVEAMRKCLLKAFRSLVNRAAPLEQHAA
jgi:hypothetical protein